MQQEQALAEKADAEWEHSEQRAALIYGKQYRDGTYFAAPRNRLSGLGTRLMMCRHPELTHGAAAEMTRAVRTHQDHDDTLEQALVMSLQTTGHRRPLQGEPHATGRSSAACLRARWTSISCLARTWPEAMSRSRSSDMIQTHCVTWKYGVAPPAQSAEWDATSRHRLQQARQRILEALSDIGHPEATVRLEDTSRYLGPLGSAANIVLSVQTRQDRAGSTDRTNTVITDALMAAHLTSFFNA